MGVGVGVLYYIYIYIEVCILSIHIVQICSSSNTTVFVLFCPSGMCGSVPSGCST